MAYREFRNAKTYEAPEIDILPKTIAVVQSAVQQRARAQQQNRNLAATIKADKAATKFTTDSLDINHRNNIGVQMATNDMMKYGFLQPETSDFLARIRADDQLSANQYIKTEAIRKQIDNHKISGPKQGGNYYNRSYDDARWVKSAWGDQDERVYWGNRDERLDELASTIGKDYINSFNKEAFLNDYIDELKTQTRSKDSKGQSGIKTGSKVTAVFFDDNGVPRVTDKHAIQALDSSPDLRERYKQEVDLSLLDDAKKMMATKEGEWLKGMTPAQIIEAFRDDPSLNTESKLKPGQRELQLAKQDLERRQRVSLDNSYDAGDYTDESGLGITNKKVGHSYTFHAGNFAGPGGVLPLKTGKAFNIPSTSPNRVDLNTGRVSHSLKGKRDFNVEGYELVPVQAGNNPMKIEASSPDEYIEQIKKIPLSAFDPSNANHIQGMQVGLRGTTFDKARIIQATFDAERPLNKQYAEAVKAGDEETMARIDKQKEAINKLRQQAGQDELDEEDTAEFQSLLPFLGIEGIEYNELILANPQDIANVKAVTGGFDISNPKNWDENMVRVKQAFEQRKAEAERANYNREATREMTTPATDESTPPKPPKTSVPAIPEGRIVVVKDGQRFHIPLEQKEEAMKAGYKLEN